MAYPWTGCPQILSDTLVVTAQNDLVYCQDNNSCFLR